jgi:protein-tyrosine phosphatase
MPKILVVCTGNLCRSPMTAALLADRLAHDPLRQGWLVKSAGVWAYEGQPASQNAVLEMRERGIRLEDHRSQPVAPDLVEEADLVLAMTRNHVESIRLAFPDQAHKVRLLSEMIGGRHDIADPYGGSRRSYAATARSLEALIDEGYDTIVALAGGAACDE